MIQEYLDMILTTRQRMVSGTEHTGRKDWQYKCLEEFIQKEGTDFAPPSGPLPDNITRGTEKECYKNCFDLVMGSPVASMSQPGFSETGLTYCEGFAVSTFDDGEAMFPMLHAWVVDADGIAHEPTWPKAGIEYFGIRFKTAWVFDEVIKQEHYGVLDAWPDGWPLLRGIDPVEWNQEMGMTEEDKQGEHIQ